MKKWILASLLSFSLQASAIYNYELAVPKLLEAYFSTLILHPAAQPVSTMDANKCAPVYQNMIKDGVLDIRYALGYFDDSAGGGEKKFTRFVNGTGLENYGKSPSLDPAIFQILRDFLKGPCTHPNQMTCGFKESGDALTGKVILEKDISLLGQKVLVRMTLTRASASESFNQNLTSLADTQKAFTLQSEANYFDGIKSADVIFYNGHSRHGGGPDFSPVVLKADGTPDYDNYYKVKRTGIRRVLQEVKSRPDKDYVLGVFACYSANYYEAALFTARPGIKTIFSVFTINYFDSLTSSLGYIEGFMHGLCDEDLSALAKQNEAVKVGIGDFNIGTKPPARINIPPIPAKTHLID